MNIVSPESLGLPADLTQLQRPDLTGEWKPFWEATCRGELLIQRCGSCGQAQFYPRFLCMRCGGEPGWVAASGLGTLYSYTIVGKSLLDPFKAMAPYVVALVDLEEGVRMMTNLLGARPESLEIGMPLAAVLVRIDDELCLPYWTPA